MVLDVVVSGNVEDVVEVVSGIAGRVVEAVALVSGTDLVVVDVGLHFTCSKVNGS